MRTDPGFFERLPASGQSYFVPTREIAEVTGVPIGTVIHAMGVVLMALVGLGIRARLETRKLGLRHLIPITIGIVGATGLMLAVLHGIAAAIWAATYVWLGALASPRDAILYSIDSTTTRGASGLTLERHWLTMGALEAAGGMLLFGISTAYIFAVMQVYWPMAVDVPGTAAASLATRGRQCEGRPDACARPPRPSRTCGRGADPSRPHWTRPRLAGGLVRGAEAACRTRACPGRHPRLLVLDEPLGALDALTRIEMQDLIESVWQDKGFTAIVVTHDVSEAVALADRILLLEDGLVAMDVAVDLPRPRRRGDPRAASIEGRILDRLLQRRPSEYIESRDELPRSQLRCRSCQARISSTGNRTTGQNPVGSCEQRMTSV
jgi:hypothetical protein